MILILAHSYREYQEFLRRTGLSLREAHYIRHVNDTRGHPRGTRIVSLCWRPDSFARAKLLDELGPRFGGEEWVFPGCPSDPDFEWSA